MTGTLVKEFAGLKDVGAQVHLLPMGAVCREVQRGSDLFDPPIVISGA
jgi:hypothetical protein